MLEKNRRITNLRKLSLAGSYLTDVERRDNKNCNRTEILCPGVTSHPGAYKSIADLIPIT